MLRGEIHVEEHFKAFELELFAATRRAVDKVADGALEQAQSAPIPAGYRIQGITAAVVRSGVERTEKGAGAWLIARDWRSLFFELGTYQRRRRKLKQPRSSSRANQGVWPAYFLSRAATWARKELPVRIAEEIELIRLL
jgi:hypothetical protein